MCNACRRLEHDLAQSRLPDAITRARKRLQCYYECVTRDEDIFDQDEQDDEEETLNFWEPPY